MTMMIMKKNNIINKKAKGIKKTVIKDRIMFENYKDCLFNNKIKRKSQQTFKSDLHNVDTIEVNNVALSSNDSKRLQTFHRVTSFPHGTNALKLCKNEMQDVCKAKETFLSEDRENDMYVTCNIFLKYMEAKCKSEIKKYVKTKAPVSFNGRILQISHTEY